MQNELIPFAIRFIGFSPIESDMLEATLAVAQGRRYRYSRLADENLQDPDLYLANADELKALVVLSDLKPSDIRPALLVGTPDVALPYCCIERPIRWQDLFGNLDKLIERRTQLLNALEASSSVVVPERRRAERLDLELSDPADYEKLRSTVAPRTGILIVDKTPVFRDYLADALASRKITVDWTSHSAHALTICNQQVISVVMINTSTPGIDPYALCHDIKQRLYAGRTTVIFLVDKNYEYDRRQARSAGCDGFLTKPLSSHQLFPILGKFLPMSR